MPTATATTTAPATREKTKQGLDTLIRVGNVQDGKIPEVPHDGDIETVKNKLKDVLSAKHKAAIELAERRQKIFTLKSKCDNVMNKVKKEEDVIRAITR